MLKLLLGCAALFAVSCSPPPNVPAAERGGEKNICYIIGGDYHKCMLASRYCFWDPEDNRCEPFGGGYCGNFYHPGHCGAQPGCFWDPEDNRCEPVE